MEVWDSCMKPSIVQIVQYMSTFFLWNIAFRLTSQTGECVCVCVFIRTPTIDWLICCIFSFSFHLTNATTVDIAREFKHLASIVCGIALLYFSLGLDSLYSVGFTIITYLFFTTITRLQLRMYGITLTSFCLVSLTIGFVHSYPHKHTHTKTHSKMISIEMDSIFAAKSWTPMYWHGIVCVAHKW